MQLGKYRGIDWFQWINGSFYWADLTNDKWIGPFPTAEECLKDIDSLPSNVLDKTS